MGSQGVLVVGADINRDDRPTLSDDGAQEAADCAKAA
jgi:hypothetical protein